MQICQPDLIDPTQFDASSKYYDAKSTVEKPRWQTVKVEYVETFPMFIALDSLRQQFSSDQLWVVRPGNRLSVMPVSEPVAQTLLAIGRKI